MRRLVPNDITRNCFELTELGRSALHLTHQKTAKEFYRSTKGSLAFEKVGDVVVVAGEPELSPSCDLHDFMAEFLDHCHARGRAVCGYYFPPSYKDLDGFRSSQVGVVRRLDLRTFAPVGHSWRDYRRARNVGAREELSVRECEYGNLDMGSLLQLEKKWLENKIGPRIHFLLSPLNRLLPQGERTFVSYRSDRPESFVSLLPYWGESGGPSYYVDQMLWHPEGHTMALSFLFAEIIHRLKMEQVHTLDFGFCAFQNISITSLLESVFASADHASWVYNAKGIYSFKKKFTDQEEKAYLLTDNKHTLLKQLHAIAKVTWTQK